MTSPIDEIKSKLDIVEVISEYVRLTPAGSNLKALCPFHKEKVPSFFVSPEKQIWKCFGCGKGGGIFDFIMEIEGVDFPQALRILAKKAGVTIKTYDYHLTSKRTKILDICREAAYFYHWFLLNTKSAQEARDYLKERKIEKMTIKEWQIGYAPNEWRVLYQYLIKKGYKPKDIEEAGLIISRTDLPIKTDEGYYDRFRGRIIFPINDIFGNVIGFSGRILPSLENEETPKYINTPETLIYNKSKTLYGLDKAKLEIKKRNYAILVEGNFDVIVAHQAGTKNTVAVSGSALTLSQIKILKRYSSNLILAFDVDPSGQASTKRGIDLALSQEMNLKVLTLPIGKDPDECIKKDKVAWFKAIKEAQPIMEYYFTSAFKDFDPAKVSDQKRVVKDLLPVIAKIGNLIEQDFWLKKLSEKAKVSYEVLRESLKKMTKEEKEDEEIIPPKKDQELEIQERFLGLLIKFPEQISSFYEELDEEIFTDERLKKILSHLKKKYGLVLLENKKINFEEFKKDLEPEISQQIDFLVLAIEKDFIDVDKKIIDKELEFLFRRLKKGFITKKLNLMIEDLKIAEKENDKEKIIKISEEINKLTRELAKY
ncbi:MAG: DNA primase [Patescibacteria group bacterium]